MITTAFFPQRPTTGQKLTADNVLMLVDQYRRQGCCIQPKLNGDRGIIKRTADGVKVWNRFGGVYSAGPVNLHPWQTLPLGTVLDGEVYRGEFLPFECLCSPEDETSGTAAFRILKAVEFCTRAHMPWVFAEPTDEWLIQQAASRENIRTRQWEGVVAKLSTAPYRLLKTADQESPTWVKLKWS